MVMALHDIEKDRSSKPADNENTWEGSDLKDEVHSNSVEEPSSRTTDDLEKGEKGDYSNGQRIYEEQADPHVPVVVHRLKRRGLFGQLTLVAEVEDPKTFSRRIKWLITFIVGFAAAAAPMGSSIFYRRLTHPRSICAFFFFFFFFH